MIYLLDKIYCINEYKAVISAEPQIASKAQQASDSFGANTELELLEIVFFFSH